MTSFVITIIVIVIILGILGLVVEYFENKQKKQQQLKQAFYRLIQAQRGEISVIQLAAETQLDGALAKKFLEIQAKNFNATLEVDINGDMYYRFPQLKFDQ